MAGRERRSINAVKNAFDELIDLWKSNQINVADVKKNLEKSVNETPTLADQAADLRKRIRADQALILDDQRKYAGVVQAYLKAAIDSAAANNPQLYTDAVAKIEAAVKSDAPQPKVLTDAIIAEFTTGESAQPAFHADDAKKVVFSERLLQ